MERSMEIASALFPAATDFIDSRVDAALRLIPEGGNVASFSRGDVISHNLAVLNGVGPSPDADTILVVYNEVGPDPDIDDARIAKLTAWALTPARISFDEETIYPDQTSANLPERVPFIQLDYDSEPPALRLRLSGPRVNLRWFTDRDEAQITRKHMDFITRACVALTVCDERSYQPRIHYLL
jgi:hypothetical protein